MGILDIIILALVAVGILRGVRSGFVRQAAGLAGIVLSFVLAASFMEPMGKMLELKLGMSQGLGPLIAFVGIFLVVRMAVHMVAGGAEKLLDTVKLSGLDRLAGGVMGGFKAIVVMSLVFLFIGLAQLPDQRTRDASEFYRPVYRLVPDAWRYLSDKAPAFEEFRKQVEERLDFEEGSIRV